MLGTEPETRRCGACGSPRLLRDLTFVFGKPGGFRCTECREPVLPLNSVHVKADDGH